MSFFNDVAAVWVKYNAQILGGVGNTMLIAIVGTLIGLFDWSAQRYYTYHSAGQE